jgi:pimeloyl-ACP methyl ester carboxylesterase
MTAMRELELSAGTIEYEDTGGDGPVVVLLHGFVMDSSLWAKVIPELAAEFRCIAPTLPLGAHRRPVKPGTDLSLRGIARLVAELLDKLDLRDVTLVGNDTGGALIQLMICEGAARVQRVVLASCEAFDNFPPGFSGKTLALSGKLPPRLFGAFMQQMRLRPMRRLPFAWGWMTKYGDAATARFMRPVMQDPAIAGDLVRALRVAVSEPHLMLEASQCLSGFDRPALVVWASADRIMPPAHGRRLAESLAQGRLVEVPDSYTLIALDQPQRFAQIIRDFAHEPGAAPRTVPAT